MNIKTLKVISGKILEEGASLSLVEICQNCQVPAETIIRLMEHGVISPSQGTKSSQWRFHQSALVRADKALRLKRDLGINLAGTALVLELLDEIETMKQQLSMFKMQ
jgi:chaperone modulatory protein CbpM